MPYSSSSSTEFSLCKTHALCCYHLQSGSQCESWGVCGTEDLKEAPIHQIYIKNLPRARNCVGLSKESQNEKE